MFIKAHVHDIIIIFSCNKTNKYLGMGSIFFPYKVPVFLSVKTIFALEQLKDCCNYYIFAWDYKQHVGHHNENEVKLAITTWLWELKFRATENLPVKQKRAETYTSCRK